MLSRIYGAPGGTEALDVLMKYMYVFYDPVGLTAHYALGSATVVHARLQTNENNCSYKGMAQGAPASSKRDITPQPTGFSQIHTRGGGEGGGQAMSVLLSWHEKVRPHAPSSLFETTRLPSDIPRSATHPINIGSCH
jgi:actin related protein 2/3 complex subunit 5